MDQRLLPQPASECLAARTGRRAPGSPALASPSRRTAVRLTALAIVAGWTAMHAATALAQASDPERTHPAMERYNRTAKGANVEEWKRRLSDPDARTRLDAVDSLGTKGGDEAIRPLIEATSDEDFRVRTRAIDFLGALRAVEATPVLMQLLFLNDVGRDEKLRSLTALGRIGDPATSERLINYAKTINDNDLACRAIYAVGEIGDKASKDKITELRGSRPGTDMDRLIADALVKIDAKAQARPMEQPTLIELEKKLARQQEQAQQKR